MIHEASGNNTGYMGMIRKFEEEVRRLRELTVFVFRDDGQLTVIVVGRPEWAKNHREQYILECFDSICTMWKAAHRCESGWGPGRLIEYLVQREYPCWRVTNPDVVSLRIGVNVVLQVSNSGGTKFVFRGKDEHIETLKGWLLDR
jgi:hypothetical protein